MVAASLRVVHVIHSLGPGGAEHTLVELAKVAPQQNMELSVVSLMTLSPGRYPQQLDRLGVAVRSLGLRSRWDPRALTRGLRVVRELGPDIVHTHLKHADLVGAYAARRLNIPMVSTLHLIEDAPTALGRAKRWLAAQARLRAAVRTIAVSAALREWYLDTFPADPACVVSIPNGVARPAPFADARRGAVRQELGVRPDALMAATVGLLRPEKGHAQLLDAAERLDPELDLQFVVVGDGPLRTGLEQRARRAGLVPDRVIFAGDREDVPEVLASSDFVVHPSLDDALPTALLHALAAGLPVVASDTGGIPEIITPGIGILVPPGSVYALVDGLQKMIEQLPASEMQHAARARFSEDFEAAIWAKRIRRLYDDALTEFQ